MNCPLCKGNLSNVTVGRTNIRYAPTIEELFEINVPAEKCDDCGEVFTGWQAGLAELRAMKRAHEKCPDKVRWTEKQENWLQRLTIKEHTS